MGTAAYLCREISYLFRPLYLIYAMIPAFSEAAWHEKVHGTAFKSPWLSRSVNFIASFMGHRDVVFSAWSHAWTNFKGTDPELPAPRPPNVLVVLWNFTRMQGSILQL